MLLRGLKATPALDFIEFPTLDAFEAFDILGNARNTPTSGRCASARAHVVLPHCRLTVQRTFPRILDVSYRIDGLLCIVPLLPSVDVKVNGISGASSRLMAVQGDATCEIFEPEANLFAILNLSTSVSQRDWQVSSDPVCVFDVINTEALQSFKRTIERLLSFASLHFEPIQPAVLRSFEEDLLLSLDGAMYPNVACSWPGQFERYRLIVRRMDEFLQYHRAEDIYLHELARACGSSVRTLQTATMAVRGMSAHRYLRLRRLWLVRQSLASGRSTLKVSEIARSHGFWHMSEFSAAYRATFGESPSDTLGRSRRSRLLTMG
jgi:AraC family ethanolamine operon transcriptional activator